MAGSLRIRLIEKAGVQFSSKIPGFRIQPARKPDVPVLLTFIKKLADYERLSHEVVATEEVLRQTLFGRRRTAEAAIGYFDKQPVGFVLFFHNYSTFLGRAGIYIEDLFVEQRFRRRGFGGALLRYVAKVANERQCGRLEWSVLDWNQPAIEFYQRLGARVLPDWRICRMTESEISNLADLK